MGTVDLLCAQGTASDIVKRAESLAQGNIVLMQPTKQAAEALDGLLELLESKGLHVVTTDEIINDG
jgi:peptidoglycan/xylan/chitin deacetylase (PgdA/CDA1 family)